MSKYIDYSPLKGSIAFQRLIKNTVDSYLSLTIKKQNLANPFLGIQKQAMISNARLIESIQDQLKGYSKPTAVEQLSISVNKSLKSSLDIQLKRRSQYFKIIDSYLNSISKVVKSNKIHTLFQDVTIENLTAFNEIDFFNKNETSVIYENQETFYSVETPSTKYVRDMTKDELEEMIQTGIASASKIKEPEKRIKTFFEAVIIGLIATGAEKVIVNYIFPLLLTVSQIAVANHDFKVMQVTNLYVNESQAASSVRKVFINNQELEQPIGQMGFLRVSSKFREYPSKNSPFSTEIAISKNTVVTPLQRKGNWIKVESETVDGVFTGWIQKSKIVKFKLDK